MRRLHLLGRIELNDFELAGGGFFDEVVRGLKNMDQPPVNPFAGAILHEKIAHRQSVINPDAWLVFELKYPSLKVGSFVGRRQVYAQIKLQGKSLFFGNLERVVCFDEGTLVITDFENRF